MSSAAFASSSAVGAATQPRLPFRDNERFLQYRQKVHPDQKYEIGFHRTAPQNVFAMFQRACLAHPERRAMTWLNDRGEAQFEWTFGEFFERSVPHLFPSPCLRLSPRLVTVSTSQANRNSFLCVFSNVLHPSSHKFHENCIDSTDGCLTSVPASVSSS